MTRFRQRARDWFSDMADAEQFVAAQEAHANAPMIGIGRPFITYSLNDGRSGSRSEFVQDVARTFSRSGNAKRYPNRCGA